jgi:6-phosphogluconate dehydrogenase (decarboxylating)
MEAVKLKGELRYISDVSNLVSLIVLQIKDNFKNVDLEKLRRNGGLVKFVMELIEAGIIVDKVISKKLIAKLDKNKLVIDIFEALFESITEDEKREIEDKIQTFLDAGIIRTNFFLFRWGRNLVRRLRIYFAV